MKKYIVPLAALFLVSCIHMAGAQEKKFEFLVGGGVDSPLRPDEFSDEFNLGWTAKLGAGYFIGPRFTLGANLSFNRFGFDAGTLVSAQDSEASGGDLSIFELVGAAKYYLLPADRTGNFYVLGGPGVAFSRTSDFTFRNIAGDLVTIEGTNETDFMFTTGVGAKYNLTQRWGVFVEARYSHLFSKDSNTSYLPIRVGIIF